MIWRILIGFIVAAAGFLVIWKSEVVFGITGTIDWAEEKLGGGGTRTFIRLMGIFIIFVGFAIITNFIADIGSAFAGLFVRT